MSGNVMCRRCYVEWCEAGENYRFKRPVPVVIHNGESLCLEHFHKARGEFTFPTSEEA